MTGYPMNIYALLLHAYGKGDNKTYTSHLIHDLTLLYTQGYSWAAALCSRPSHGRMGAVTGDWTTHIQAEHTD